MDAMKEILLSTRMIQQSGTRCYEPFHSLELASLLPASPVRRCAGGRRRAAPPGFGDCLALRATGWGANTICYCRWPSSRARLKLASKASQTDESTPNACTTPPSGMARLKRVLAIDLSRCPHGGAELQVIAAITAPQAS